MTYIFDSTGVPDRGLPAPYIEGTLAGFVGRALRLETIARGASSKVCLRLPRLTWQRCWCWESVGLASRTEDSLQVYRVGFVLQCVSVSRHWGFYMGGAKSKSLCQLFS